MTTQSILRKSVVVVLVASVALAGFVPYGLSPAGTAAADHDCSTVNKATWFGFSGISLIGEATDGSGVGCDMFHPDSKVEEIREVESNQTLVDLYAAASAEKERSDTMGAVMSNYLDDTESIAWQKAEAEVSQAYENGTTKSEAKVAAKEAVRDYYAVKQYNQIQDWNQVLYSSDYINNRAEQEGFSPNDMPIQMYYHEGDPTSWNSNGSYEVVNRTITLVNGTSVEVAEIRQDSSSPHIGIDTGVVNDGTTYYAGLNAMEPDDSGDYSAFRYLEPTEWSDRWNATVDKKDNINAEIDTFVDATWQDYQDGTIDATDVVSRTTLMFEFGTRTMNGSGNYYDAIGAAAGMGLDSPDLNGTGQMTVEIPDAGATYDGLLFARNPPGDAWEVGTTYDPANITGPVMMATTDGELFEIEREFVITGATDTEGNDQQVIETTVYNYRTANTSDLQQKYENLLRLTQQLEDRADELESGGGGGGGGDGSSWWEADYYGIPILGWIAVVLLGLGLIARGGGS